MELRFPLILASNLQKPLQTQEQHLTPGDQGVKDATGLSAGWAGMGGQRAEELLPADTLPHGSAAALCQGLLAHPVLWGLQTGAGASLGPALLDRASLCVSPGVV